MTGDKIPVTVLAVQLIANITPSLGRELGLSPRHKAVGLISTDCDDATYLALDQATKDADVDVVYAKSLYAGAANATTKLAGEVIGILAGPSPSEVQSGLDAAVSFLQSGVGFCTANDQGDVVYLAHTVARTGTYLSRLAGIEEGNAIAYLIAPPVEAMMGLDAAMKASDVEMVSFFPPPSETNFAGGLLTGTESACLAAAAAFAAAVEETAKDPQGGITWS